jgi:hypothetical protein
MDVRIGRRAALVAAVLGVLAFLGGAAVPAHVDASVARTAAAVTADPAHLAAPTSTVGDVVRGTQPAVARTTGHDRSAAPYPATSAVAAVLLLLAAAALALGVLRACRRTSPTAWRRVLAARAPPALSV